MSGLNSEEPSQPDNPAQVAEQVRASLRAGMSGTHESAESRRTVEESYPDSRRGILRAARSQVSGGHGGGGSCAGHHILPFEVGKGR
jgi:hypothetical protein